LKARPGEITLLTIGDLTNIADLITAHPDCKPWIKRVVSMGGAVRVGYNHRPPVEVEWNIKQDIKSAQIVFASGVPLVLAPLDATTHLKLDEPLRQRLFSADRPLTQQLLALSRLWRGRIRCSMIRWRSRSSSSRGSRNWKSCGSRSTTKDSRAKCQAGRTPASL
jgi:inosine-uridine nucleoside N-ribohydrolase